MKNLLPKKRYSTTFGVDPKKARNPCKIAGFKMVLRTGLEPVSLSAYAPQTYVSTNFTT